MSLKSPQRTAERIIAIIESGDYNPEHITRMIESVMASRDKRIKRLVRKSKPRVFEMTQQRITGALRDCIDAHGPITKAWIGSAAKRIYQGSIIVSPEVES